MIAAGRATESAVAARMSLRMIPPDAGHQPKQHASLRFRSDFPALPAVGSSSSPDRARFSSEWHARQTKRAAPFGTAPERGKPPASEVRVGLVADETHLLDMRALGHGEHLVDQLVPGV